MAEHCRNPLKRAYLNLLSKRLKTEEIAICNACNGMSVMSEIDAELFREAGVRVPIAVVGISTNLTPSQQVSSLEKAALSFGFHGLVAQS